MAEQLDLLDEFDGTAGSSRMIFYSIAPQFERVRAAREAPVQAAAPEPPPSEPEAAAAPPPCRG
ncbi:hypothetical protein M2232_002159 [Bradyrhizobium japonicum]|uniref:hypothetical protein n=1 Tax=Bradyrhizobium japonicum TaxID=375 RepID=UPI002227428B|nr:hypothetical protein [Bradyrhizobium japonicum]MCW2218627.1 hypothetical protein [Bradyrhizobium japonicum]MCW2343241.1 hypothetical protein [Bradyrhizobium japonicum]